MTDSSLAHLVFIIDRSGSMAGKADEAEKGARAFLDEQVAAPGRVEVTVARFDDKYELLDIGVPANRFDYDHLHIMPRGMTALFDAVGRTIVGVGDLLAARPDSQRPGRVFVMVATDGLENASHEYSSATVKELITRQTKTYGWEFIFMGTSEEAVLQATAAGFNLNTTFASSDTAAGVSSSYLVASRSVLRGRAGGQSVNVTDSDRADIN